MTISNEAIEKINLPEGYSVTSLFSIGDNLFIMSESDTEKKISISRRKADEKTTEETREFKIDRPYPIIKAFVHDT